MRKTIVLLVIALSIYIGFASTRARVKPSTLIQTQTQSPKPQPGVPIPVPPEVLREVLKKIPFPIPEDIPENRKPTPPPVAPDPNDTIPGRSTGSDMSRKIYKDGELPKEWDNLSDREVELEIFKLTRREGKPPEGWENWPKLKKAPYDPIADQWWVEFTSKIKKKDVDGEIERILRQHGGGLMFKDVDSPFRRGFWIKTDESRAEQISRDPKVRRVEQDFRPKIVPSSNISPSAKPFDTRFGVAYNLDRIDTRSRFYDGFYDFVNNGYNTDIYLVDNGVASHSEFSGRVFNYLDAFPSSPLCFHATAVASVAAGNTIGVASGANVFSVRIYDCSINVAAASTIVGYLNSIRSRIISQRPRGATVLMAVRVANAPTSLDTALDSIANQADAPIVGAAGQIVLPSSESTNHLNYWPQRHPKVYNIGFTDNFDRKIGQTCPNLGIQQLTGIELFAPAGQQFTVNNCSSFTTSAAGVPVAQIGGGYSVGTGSSVSAPLVAGVYAQIMSQNTTFHPHENQVYRSVNDMASVGVQYRSFGDPDRLLYDLFQAMPAPRNAASYAEGVAPDSLSVAFGSYNSTPNRVFIEYPGGGQAEATVTFADREQVNYWIPSTVPVETHLLKVYNNSLLLGIGVTRANIIAPGIFYGDNQLASGTLYKYNRDTLQGVHVSLTENPGNDWDPSTEDAYLIIYGTGIRNASGFSATVGGLSVPVTYAGATSGFLGLDQVNIGPLPISLRGSQQKQIRFFAGGLEANRTNVWFKFQ